jgi:S1-C subfamily serine protease
MAEKGDWQFPAELRPRPEDWRFDLDGALDAVVQLRAEIPQDAFTAQILGTERLGNGVVIRDDGLVLTIGYLITEASTIWLTTNKGIVVPAFPLAYDQATGLGLVQPLGRLGLRPLARGSAASCRIGENVVIAGHGGRARALRATVFAKREFAGYWEYVLEEAIYTAPAHPQWGGAALIGSDGKLLAIGSLLVQEKVDAGMLQGNMLVPIDLLEPVLDDMLKLGRPQRAPRRGRPRPRRSGRARRCEGGRPHRRGRRRKALVARGPVAAHLARRPLRHSGADAPAAQGGVHRAERALRRPQRLPQEAAPPLIRGQSPILFLRT